MLTVLSLFCRIMSEYTIILLKIRIWRLNIFGLSNLKIYKTVHCSWTLDDWIYFINNSWQLGFLYLTFPYYNNSPSLLLKLQYNFFISLLIAENFWFPVFYIWFRQNKMLASFMSVPETSIYKNYRLYLGKTISGLPGNLLTLIR